MNVASLQEQEPDFAGRSSTSREVKLGTYSEYCNQACTHRTDVHMHDMTALTHTLTQSDICFPARGWHCTHALRPLQVAVKLNITGRSSPRKQADSTSWLSLGFEMLEEAVVNLPPELEHYILKAHDPLTILDCSLWLDGHRERPCTTCDPVLRGSRSYSLVTW